MREFFSKYKTFALVMLLLSAIIVTLFYSALKPEQTLPVYQPTDFDAKLVDSSIQLVRKYHTIADFSLLNQNGKTITQEDYRDKIYIADFFFTTCPSICPIMTRNMADLQEELKEQEDVMLLSHSVTPEIDSVPRLKAYALENGVIDEKWNLLTGPKKDIYELARKSYLVVQEDGDGGPFDMIHTENFVLVDKERRIRGTYDGTKKEDMERLLADVEILRESYDD
ncbi:SCO family protein [Zeaxanthinibacter enoshimensis]|uniref:Protein SCO1/2 n=1 Tax=Zeaxanthinibacter enoshimensis TaxID=392009 RepID=A0A4R6TUF5_9FLAO|nr:SCO family protein [Zeaxanthinibacter enoshimensis]TDQ32568.1 protein SCO1/2 [Zeaxanthinibacter enoshimensis]